MLPLCRGGGGGEGSWATPNLGHKFECPLLQDWDAQLQFQLPRALETDSLWRSLWEAPFHCGPCRGRHGRADPSLFFPHKFTHSALLQQSPWIRKELPGWLRRECTILHLPERLTEGPLTSGGIQRSPGPPAEGAEEGFLREVSSELGLRDGDGEVLGENSESPLFLCLLQAWRKHGGPRWCYVAFPTRF